MNLGRAIRLCRQRIGWTQDILARNVGISTSHLSLIEAEKRDPSISTVQRIARAMEMPFSVLIFLAADRSELEGIDKELCEKLSFIALQLLDDAPRQKTLL